MSEPPAEVRNSAPFAARDAAQLSATSFHGTTILYADPWGLCVQACASAALTRSGVSGARRMRTPVASKNAFATAPGMLRIEGSPAPLGATLGWLIKTISIDSGASPSSRIG